MLTAASSVAVSQLVTIVARPRSGSANEGTMSSVAAMGLATVFIHYGIILSQMRRGADAKHGLRRLLIVCWVVALSLDTRQGSPIDAYKSQT